MVWDDAEKGQADVGLGMLTCWLPWLGRLRLECNHRLLMCCLS